MRDLTKELSALRMQITLMIVSPEMARQWLAQNSDNRAIRPSVVARYAADLRGDLWVPTHQGVAISVAGRLLDGQHRLMAIVETGISAIMPVAFNVPETSFAKMDRGRSRTTADALREDQRAVAVARALFSVGAGRQSSVVTDDEQRVTLHAFRQEIETILRAVPSAERVLSSAPIRAAAALRLAVGEREAWITATLRAFVARSQDMPPHLWAMLRQLEAGTITARRGAHDLFIRGWKAFEEASAGSKIMRVLDSERDRIIKEVQPLIMAKIKESKHVP